MYLQQVACCPGTSRREAEKTGLCWVFTAHNAFLRQNCPQPGVTSQYHTARNTKAFCSLSCLNSKMPVLSEILEAVLPEAVKGWGNCTGSDRTDPKREGWADFSSLGKQGSTVDSRLQNGHPHNKMRLVNRQDGKKAAQIPPTPVCLVSQSV